MPDEYQKLKGAGTLKTNPLPIIENLNHFNVARTLQSFTFYPHIHSFRQIQLIGLIPREESNKIVLVSRAFKNR
jgi:hypothetical protein